MKHAVSARGRAKSWLNQKASGVQLGNPKPLKAAHRAAHLLSQLVAKLHDRGILDDGEIDDMLFNLLG